MTSPQTPAPAVVPDQPDAVTGVLMVGHCIGRTTSPTETRGSRGVRLVTRPGRIVAALNALDNRVLGPVKPPPPRFCGEYMPGNWAAFVPQCSLRPGHDGLHECRAAMRWSVSSGYGYSTAPFPFTLSTSATWRPLS